jgi:hypothetical protein
MATGNFARDAKTFTDSKTPRKNPGLRFTPSGLRDFGSMGIGTLKLIVRANGRRDKIELLHDIREETEELKVVLRLCQDVKAFQNFNSFEHVIGLVTLRYARCATQGDPSIRFLRNLLGNSVFEIRLAWVGGAERRRIEGCAPFCRS